MKSLRKSSKSFIGKEVILPLLILLLMVGVLFYGMRWFNNVNTEQNRVLTEQSLKKAAVQCYANEGMYPADVEYLTENYYVNIDYTRYNVVYDCFASNVMPNIKVYSK